MAAKIAPILVSVFIVVLQFLDNSIHVAKAA
jgi:hypothetical protein